jgi:hypothetical protein
MEASFRTFWVYIGLGKFNLETRPHIVQNKPYTVVESDIVQMTICNTLPIIFLVPQCDILITR